MLSRVTESAGEKYVYGLASPAIRSRRADVRACGVYATDKRIFMVRAPLRIQMMFLLPWSVAVVLLGSDFGISLSLFSTGNGVYSWPGPQLILLLTGFAFLFVALALSYHKDFSEVPIQELERRKIYDVERGQISGTAMSRSAFWTSRITVYLRGGVVHSILFAEPGSYDRARRVFEMP